MTHADCYAFVCAALASPVKALQSEQAQETGLARRAGLLESANHSAIIAEATRIMQPSAAI